MLPIFDSHCHVYPDKIASRAAQSIAEFYDMPVRFDGTASTLLQEGTRAGITHYLIHSVSVMPAQVRSINEFIAAQVNEHPGVITGFGTLHPDSKDLDGDLQHLLSLGLKGVKIHPDFQKFAADSAKAVNLCRKLIGKLPVLVHAGDTRFHYSHPQQILNLKKKLPDLTVIAAHFGGWSCWDDAEKELPGLPNFYVDCSSSLYALSPEKAKHLFEVFGPEKVLFGTDYPMWSPSSEMELFSRVGLSPREQRRVLYENAAELFPIE
ncbi:MAG TPA: amidohydrolase family protein [Oscillospiraceae bacterium]|nr:amidohydrolase family protein [Oscillospiraceae bacterium]HPS34393.1 amidohydrolase family protein [Oscillospiraceae bacterium]